MLIVNRGIIIPTFQVVWPVIYSHSMLDGVYMYRTVKFVLVTGRSPLLPLQAEH